MEEINLFNDLNLIKNAIDKDLTILEKIQNEVKIRVVYDNNRELADRIHLLTNTYTSNIAEIKNRNFELEKELNLRNEKITDKNKEIIKLKDEIKGVIDEKASIEIDLIKIKNENLRMDKIIKDKEDRKEFERKNKEFLINLYNKELRDLNIK